jgi:hypothetical protein
MTKKLKLNSKLVVDIFQNKIGGNPKSPPYFENFLTSIKYNEKKNFVKKNRRAVNFNLLKLKSFFSFWKERKILFLRRKIGKKLVAGQIFVTL